LFSNTGVNEKVKHALRTPRVVVEISHVGSGPLSATARRAPRIPVASSPNCKRRVRCSPANVGSVRSKPARDPVRSLVKATVL
jgi:hypothetical protein